MLIVYAYFLVFLATISLEAAVSHHSEEPSRSRHFDIAKRSDAHRVYFDYYAGGSLGRDCRFSYGNIDHTQTNYYMVQDCVKLIQALAGHDELYTGSWYVSDKDCFQGDDYWWITVAGWGTCNFAIVMPTCSSIT